VVFPQREDHTLHQLQLAIGKGTGLREILADPDAESEQRWLRPPEEAAALFHDLPEALEETRRIASQCSLALGVCRA
jgi:DNA polymerase-3 subunit alpha